MSRTKAKQSIDLEEYKASMQGIYSTSVNAETLMISAPMAYKSLEDIIDVIRDSVHYRYLKPVYNFKTLDGEVPWKRRLIQ